MTLSYAQRLSRRECQYCDRVLSDSKARSVHENSVHTFRLRFACWYCPKVFKSQSSRSRCHRRHRRASRDRIFQQRKRPPPGGPCPPTGDYPLCIAPADLFIVRPTVM
ncbi:hypothetical protein M407DRAFT_18380 [Tulasnella calospora MUT 4182]|uniref:C2H2-type domain-containing protein n=1 Tax=Tulasnella calospora MUT 4182 TaxID=1051891 RepID=A0A0C3MFV1_9AGAM|nr:hypothetical protein M407DRAFT_18380 [Tulasnella calospora MUT 4182]